MIIVSEMPNLRKPPNAVESEKTMYKVVSIEAGLTKYSSLKDQPQGIETNGQWVEVDENDYGKIFLAAYEGALYKAQIEEDSTPIDEIFPDVWSLSVSVIDCGHVRMSNETYVTEVTDILDDEDLQETMRDGKAAVFYKEPQGWRQAKDCEDAAEKLAERNGVVLFISDTPLDEVGWDKMLHLYLAWADGFIWCISRAEDVELGKNVTHFTISDEVLPMIEWSHELGCVIFTPESWGYNEPDVPIQALL